MFEDYSPEKVVEKKKMKSVFLMLNGKPGQLFKYQFSKPISKVQLTRAAQKNWGTNIFKNLRIFSTDAVQYFDEDLGYIKNGERLYLSRGEDFDSNSNFGEFEIIKKLGEGGFGSVQLARNIITGELAAIKILKTDKNSSSTDIDMIFKESQILKSLNHPNIVKILNCYAMTDMKVVIVMEYLEGGELLTLLKQKTKFQQAIARMYFKQLISAVWYCHRQGIIHRDLKLQNILMKNLNTVKVADFGISGVADRFNPEADWGTLRYMAPQVLSGKNKLNSTGVDVWACGVILYFMVTGNLPFNGQTTQQIIESIIKKPVDFPNTVNLTVRCKSLIKKMLNKNPDQRISMFEVENDAWVTNRQERVSQVIKTAVSEEFNVRLIDIKKQQRKSINLPKPIQAKVPKRLQKQKDRLIQELKQYKVYKKPVSSQKKLFPSLKRRQKYADINKLDRGELSKKQSEHNKKKQGDLIFRK